MRVRVLKDTTAYWNYAIQVYRAGDELDGDLARHLADNAPKNSVEVTEPDPEPDAAVDTPPAAPGAEDGNPADEPPVSGTADDLMTWVGDDAGRAAAALAAEQAKDKPRSTVVKRLQALVEE